MTPQCHAAWKIRAKTLRGPNSPNFKGVSIDKKGYRVISVPREDGHWKQRPEHILIAERALGRRLKKNEVVHHIDGDRQNNMHSNLMVCSVGYHRWLHERMSLQYQIEHFRDQKNTAVVKAKEIKV